MIGIDALRYNRDFQIGLLTHLINDHKFLADTINALKLSDFDISACRIIFEVVCKFYAEYRIIPPKDIIIALVTTATRSAGLYETNITPSEYEMLTYIMGMVVNYRSSNAAVEYYRKELLGYLKHIRTSQAQERTMNNPTALLDEIAVIDNELRTMSGEEFVFQRAMAPTVEEAQGISRLGTGLNIIDSNINHGLKLGQTGMIVACTGVGKTCGLINFAVDCTLRNKYGLFITLELPGDDISHRYQSMMMHMDASLFAKPRSEWPAYDKNRWDWGTSDQFPFKDNIFVYDASLKATNVDMLEKIIYHWKNSLTKKGVSEHDCMVVYIDWLEKIDTTGVRGVTRNTNDATKYKLVLEAIGEVARRNRVIGWTATQATRSAIGREILRIDHTAHSIHAHDPLDFSFGLAPVQRPGENIATGDVEILEYNDDDLAAGIIMENMAVCDRFLNASLFKTRYSTAVGKVCRFYQGHTLRFWDNESRARRVNNLVTRGEYENMLIEMSKRGPRNA